MGQLPEALKNVENHIKNTLKKSPNSDNCTTIIDPPVQNNHTQDSDEFFAGCADLLGNNRYPKQTKGSALVFPVKIPSLPAISDENLPKWKKLKKN